MANFAYRIDIHGKIGIFPPYCHDVIHPVNFHDQTCAVCGKLLPKGTDAIIFFATLVRGENRHHYACPSHMVGIISEKSSEGINHDAAKI